VNGINIMVLIASEIAVAVLQSRPIDGRANHYAVFISMNKQILGNRLDVKIGTFIKRYGLRD
jgi:hypothetical protein